MSVRENKDTNSRVHGDPRFIEARPERGKKVHWFPLGLRFRGKGAYAKAICGARIAGDVIQVTFESGNEYCAKCETKVANAVR